MAHEDPHHEPHEPTNPDPSQSPDLDGTIDALLNEIDASRAPGQKADESTTSASGDDPVTNPTSDGADAEGPGDEALSALGTVEGNAQSLIEEAIGDLLDAQEDEQTPDDDDGAGSPESAAHVEADEQAGGDGGLDDAELLAQIADELASGTNDTQEEVGGDSSPVTKDATVETIAEAIEEPVAERALELAEEPADETGNEEGDEEGEEADPESVSGEGNAEADHSPESLADLDAALAGMSDELLMGDFESPDGEVTDGSGMNQSIDPAMLLDQLGLSDEEPGPDAQPVKAQHAQAAKASVPKASSVSPEPVKRAADSVGAATLAADAPSRAVGAVSAISAVSAPRSRGASVTAGPTRSVRPVGDEGLHGSLGLGEEEVVESIWQTARRVGMERCIRALALARERGWPLTARLMLKVSAPIKDKPRVLRDSVGYIALWTLLLASVLWFYVVFLRTSPVPSPTQAPTRMLSPDEATPARVAGEATP